MKELYNVLTERISVGKGISITIDVKIPKTAIRILPSETMILYGIGKQNELGFTLHISIDHQSNKGKSIIEELTKDEILKDFKIVNEKKSNIYVADFEKDIDSIVTKINEVLDRLKLFVPQSEPGFIIQQSESTFGLDGPN